MRVFTAGDSNFYSCLEQLAKSVRELYGEPLIVYDIGLTEEQASTLDCTIHKVEVGKEHLAFTVHNKTSFINATHKPHCIKQYFEHYPSPAIYVDADCVFRGKVELNGFDIGVTVKPKKKRDTTNFYNGIINTGVIFFNTYPQKLINRWIEECSTGQHTDQSALAKMLSERIDWKETGNVYDWYGISVKTLPVEDYNDYYLKSGKIFHFKGERHNPKIYYKLLETIRNGGDAYSQFRDFTKKQTSLTEKVKRLFRQTQ
jgi:hypothetical protein